jgi:hypothetical protein
LRGHVHGALRGAEKVGRSYAVRGASGRAPTTEPRTLVMARARIPDGDDGVGARQQLGVGIRPPPPILTATFDREPPFTLGCLRVTSVENDFYGVVVGESFLEIGIEIGDAARQDEQMTGHLCTSVRALGSFLIFERCLV